MRGEATVWNQNAVTTPRVPPPPPRQAQYSSGSLLALAVRIWPSAVTTWTCVIVSQVRPNARLPSPNPPPRLSPATPTDGQEPAGITRPFAARLPYTSFSRAPPPTLATLSASNAIVLIGRTSITMPPWVVDAPT